TPAATPPSTAPAAAEVPLRDRPLPERIAATTPTVPTPSSQTDGTITVSAVVCTIDGAPFTGDDAFTTIGPIAWSSDGALYLSDNDGKVRRYTVQAGDACALTMDTTFGANGLLAVGDGMSARVESIVADAQGHVFVATSMRGTTRITGTHVDYQCDTRGRLSVSPDGTTGVAVFGSGPAQLVTFTDAGCTTAPFEMAEAFQRIEGTAFLENDRILVGGQNDVRDPHLVRVYDRRGRAQGAVFGDQTGEMNHDDHFCYVHGATPCGAGICVHDGNCRTLRVFGADHAVLGAPNVMRLIGLSYPWVPSTTGVRDGVAYLTASQQRGTASERTGVYDGYVFRLNGL
ncbi:MAG: hypothetical protein J0L92_23785, partial [Deltaproteobacteria bacterium]|nr:hypothetical protein [Deltaproteobacteria bacterium]